MVKTNRIGRGLIGAGFNGLQSAPRTSWSGTFGHSQGGVMDEGIGCRQRFLLERYDDILLCDISTCCKYVEFLFL